MLLLLEPHMGDLQKTNILSVILGAFRKRGEYEVVGGQGQEFCPSAEHSALTHSQAPNFPTI